MLNTVLDGTIILIATLLGNYGVNPVPHKHLSSLFVSVGSTSVLIDCGEGTQLAIREQTLRLTNLSLICLTHYHPDHILGLPGLISTLDTAIRDAEVSRKRSLIIVGPEDPNDTVHKLVSVISHTNLQIRFIGLKANKEYQLDFPGFTLTAFPVKHSIDCFGYTIEEFHNPKMDILKAAESGIDQQYWNFLQYGYHLVNDENELHTIDSITSGDMRIKKVAYSTDTLPVASIRNHCENAQLAVLEGMFYSGFVTSNGKNKEMKGCHMTFEEAASIAREANVEELWLTHFSPILTDPEAGLEKTLSIFPNTRCGRFGMQKEVK